MHESIYMSDEKEEELKEGELDVDALDGAFDDHGFGAEDQTEPVEILGDEDGEDEESAEWLTHDDNKDW